MAEIVLAPLLQVIFDKIADPFLQGFANIWKLDDRFKNLQKLLPMAQAVIQDAEERQATDTAIRIWLSQLKDATCEVEDLLEEFMHRRVGPGRYHGRTFTRQRQIFDDLSKALAEGLRLPLAERNIVASKFDKRETSSFLVGSEVYGREEDKNKILDMILQSSGESCSVVSVVGTPGIGKSTLAQMVYNDEEVKKHFDSRIWVFTSPDFQVKRIIKTAIESATGEKCDSVELNALQIKLWNALHEKKFLLVLDDVWNEDEDEWDKLRFLFNSGLDGSRILVTTRSQKVAMVVGCSNLEYHLKGLCEEDCWALFKKRAFLNQPEEEKRHPNLVQIGKEIVRKCEGVPLAAKVVGGLVRYKKQETDWLHVRNSNMWDLGVYKKGIYPALLVSYMHLPPHLKHCFVFCSVFPKNHEIQRKPIVQMWIALGFIASDGESKALEDVGDECFNELLWMSVFEEIEESKGSGSLTGYKMNGTFYSLARFLGKNETLVLDQDTILEHTRHASFVPKYSDMTPIVIPRTLSQSRGLRTLLVFSEGGIPTMPLHIFSSFIFLRILKLSGCQMKLPESIGDLSLLKYLDVSHSHFRELPSSISGLSFLQVLNLFGCYKLILLPIIDRNTALRHLDICGCEALMEMPAGIGELVYLKTLPIFIVRPEALDGL